MQQWRNRQRWLGSCVPRPLPAGCALPQLCIPRIPTHCRPHLPCFPCCRDDGVGLAAPQVGVNVRLMVFNEAGVKGEGEEVSISACDAHDVCVCGVGVGWGV